MEGKPLNELKDILIEDLLREVLMTSAKAAEFWRIYNFKDGKNE